MEAVLHGPLGRTVLGATPLTIGSAASNQLVLNDASVGIQQAEIRPSEQGYSIVDLGSGAGTFVNEQQLSPHTPHMLRNGDAVRIGSTRLTYEETSGSSIPPTVYVAPGQSSGSSYPPTVLVPGGSSISSTAYGASSSSSDDSGYLSNIAPPPPPVDSSNLSNPYENAMSMPAPQKKRGRRGLWIILGVIGAILVLGAVLFFVLAGHRPSTTPNQTFQAYCAAVKAHNGHAAYGFFSTNAKSQVSEETEIQIVNAMSDCAVSNVNDSAGTGVITYTLASSGKIIKDFTVIDEDNTWKLDAQNAHSTPALTLLNYCNALVKGDYQTAYNQFSSDGQKLQGTESQFAASFNGGKPSDCTLSNVDDVAGKGMVTMTFSGGSQVLDETLTQEKGTWKISNEQVHSTPTVTLRNYCSALKQQDYQTAYNQLSSDQQSLQTETQYANTFKSAQVSDCSVSNVNDSAGTGTISYTLSNGSNAIADYTLVQENGTWKIKTEQARQ